MAHHVAAHFGAQGALMIWDSCRQAAQNSGGVNVCPGSGIA
jgi:hypothetical protein